MSLKKVPKCHKPLRQQRLHLELELSFASLLVVNILVNANSKTKPTKGHLKQVQVF